MPPAYTQIKGESFGFGALRPLNQSGKRDIQMVEPAELITI